MGTAGEPWQVQERIIGHGPKKPASQFSDHRPEREGRQGEDYRWQDDRQTCRVGRAQCRTASRLAGGRADGKPAGDQGAAHKQDEQALDVLVDGADSNNGQDLEGAAITW
jgi:hypothetical protein